MKEIKIVLDDKFQEHKDNFIKSMETNSDLKKAYEETTFAEGTKLTIEVEVTDRFLSDSLMGLLFDRIDGQQHLGFKVLRIGMHPYVAPNNRDLTVQELENLISHMNNVLNTIKGGPQYGQGF